jgi:hypothetical protein
MRCISVTWVVSGKMANRDAERGFKSPWMKNMGVVVTLSLSAPKFREHAVTAECGRNDDCPSHFVRMADRSLHRHGSAHAVADKVGSRDFEMVEQGRHVVGEVFVGDISCDIRRAALTLHFDGNDFPCFGELADPPGA